MGSSVFHGGFSTFLAILVLAPGKTYVFVVFFRIWVGIIVFGMANGFFLLPVILSFIGPIHTAVDPDTHLAIDQKPKIAPISDTKDVELTETANINTKKTSQKKIISELLPADDDAKTER